ncbi:MAG: RsmB/NOP family class I SAM-dependent RNA methyltransferase [Ruminococcus sp.]|nr:RsmB/NOP family class I SAM-dependent RNA methyltransferase [Ruminococcus sp.]
MEIFLSRMKSLLGDEFDEFLKFYNSDENFRGLRVNTLKCSADKLRSLLDFDLEQTPFCRDGFYIPHGVKSIGNNPLHHAGAFYVQEPSATSAVTMLDVQKGDRVLDLCAAPGGKSTQIAAALDGEGLLWSNEIVRNRAIILLSNIERMGVRNAVVSNCHPDALCNRLRGYFDKVLVDAPCSGEGMFRKNSAAQTEWSVEHVKSCAARQLEILNSAKNALKCGGVLVYSTCTFSEEENEGVITEFLRQNPDFTLEDSGVNFGRTALTHARRIFPMDGGEGHFAARLRKISDTVPVPEERKRAEKNPQIVADFYADNFVGKPFGDNLEIIGDKIYISPEHIPSISGLSVLRKGILLGEIKKNRVEPHHCAFMAAKPEDCARSVDFDVNSEEIKKFLHGDEIKVNGDIKGYTAVCVNGITVGFGKVSNGNLKNKYPKGLRTL